MSETIIASDAQIWSTPGGVHPPENKAQSMALPLGDMAIPTTLTLPLNQHIGTPATPIVTVGEYVKAGQKVADANGPMSVPVHASTSGTISAIEERPLPHASGMNGLCIVLDADGKHTSIDYTLYEDWQALPPQDALNRIREAGIAGLGGAGFPTAIKLHPKGHQIDTLILNGTECEPYITADDRLMQDYADDIVAGAQLLQHILGHPQRTLIGIEDNKPDAIRAMQAAVQRAQAAGNHSLQVISFPTKYPSGGEKQLIQILTGQEVPSGTLPAALGIVVQNVGTAAAAYRAVRYGEPLTQRITTVVGEALKTQRNVRVLLGTPVQHLLDEHGLRPADCSRVIMGGPMMGFALPHPDVPVVKTSNCIIAPSHTEMPEPPPAQACIRCGLCAEACPASLLPQQLYWYARAEEYERLQNHNLFDCIECGACAYVCPSSIPLVQYYRAAKGTIRQQEQERIKADHARQRFEFRKLRIEKAEQAKEAKRLARKKAAEEAKRLAVTKQTADKDGTNKSATAPSTSTATDPVAAAMARVQTQSQDPAAQQARLQRAITCAQSRVDKLQQRLATAESDQQDALSAQLKQAQVRLADAQQKLTDANASANTADTPPPTSSEVQEPSAKREPPVAAKPPATDAATAAIEKAKARANAMAQMTPEEKLKNQLASLTTRVAKAREKLRKAEEEGSEHIDALRTGLAKMESKLAATQAELETL